MRISAYNKDRPQHAIAHCRAALFPAHLHAQITQRRQLSCKRVCNVLRYQAIITKRLTFSPDGHIIELSQSSDICVRGISGKCYRYGEISWQKYLLSKKTTARKTILAPQLKCVPSARFRKTNSTRPLSITASA